MRESHTVVFSVFSLMGGTAGRGGRQVIHKTTPRGKQNRFTKFLAIWARGGGGIHRGYITYGSVKRGAGKALNEYRTGKQRNPGKFCTTTVKNKHKLAHSSKRFSSPYAPTLLTNSPGVVMTTILTPLSTSRRSWAMSGKSVKGSHPHSARMPPASCTAHWCAQ